MTVSNSQLVVAGSNIKLKNEVKYLGIIIDKKLTFEYQVKSVLKQAGTGTSRRHIQGSKIAKKLPSVKYSFTVVENRKFFEIFFLKKYILKKWTEWRAGGRYRQPMAR